jgi:hypothetical protein
MNIAQVMINAGLNYFGAQLLAESLLKSPIATQIADKGEPLKIMIPINRSDCAGWIGVEMTLNPINTQSDVKTKSQEPDITQNIEILTWYDTKTTKPDADRSVLCCREEDFFRGYYDHDDEAWISDECGGIIDGVLYWADPTGPQ